MLTAVGIGSLLAALLVLLYEVPRGYRFWRAYRTRLGAAAEVAPILPSTLALLVMGVWILTLVV